MGRVIDLTGNRFGSLTVIEFIGLDKQRNARWKCVCDCGNYSTPAANNLKAGVTTSCGCVQRKASKEYNTKHGLSTTSTYTIWHDMVRRCTDPRRIRYSQYGGRGITVCDDWMYFENFVRDMGQRPNKLTLERKDNDKGYSKDNCIWATQLQQSRNKRTNKLNIPKVKLIKYMFNVTSIDKKTIKDHFGISIQLLNAVLKNKIWKDITN